MVGACTASERDIKPMIVITDRNVAAVKDTITALYVRAIKYTREKKKQGINTKFAQKSTRKDSIANTASLCQGTRKRPNKGGVQDHARLWESMHFYYNKTSRNYTGKTYSKANLECRHVDRS